MQELKFTSESSIIGLDTLLTRTRSLRCAPSALRRFYAKQSSIVLYCAAVTTKQDGHFVWALTSIDTSHAGRI